MSAPATYTLEDLKQHKTRQKLWVTIHQNVYDVTDFLDQVGGRWGGRCGFGEAGGGIGMKY